MPEDFFWGGVGGGGVAKNQHFYGQNSTFTQTNSMRAVLEIF